MKKQIIFTLFLSIVCSQALAAQGPDAAREAHRQEMTAIKKAQREGRKAQATEAKNAAPGFWAREAERSGFSSMRPTSTWAENLNPVPFFKSQDEQYKVRKAASKGK